MLRVFLYMLTFYIFLCVQIDVQHGEIKELQRLVSSQAMQLGRQSGLIDGLNQEMDTRRSQVSKMDSWIRQEEIWRHDIEDQVNVLNKRAKNTERVAKETTDSITEINLKIDAVEHLMRNTTSMTSAFSSQTDAFVSLQSVFFFLMWFMCMLIFTLFLFFPSKLL